MSTSLLDIDPRSLVVLHLVAANGSMSAAARELGWTHPAVSQHISRLERSLGCQLLQRHGRGARLTNEGEQLLRHADDLAAVLRAAVGAGEELRAGTSTPLRVASFPTACATLLIDAISAATRRHSDLRVRIQQAEPPEALAALRSGTADLAVTFHDAPPTRAQATVLGVDDAVVAVPPGHPLVEHETIAVSDLEAHTVIAGCPTCRARLERHCDLHGARLHAHEFVTDDYVVMQAMVSSGQGLAVLPQLAVRAHRRHDLRFVPLSPPLRRHVAVHLPERRSVPDSAHTLLTALTRRATSLNVSDE